MDRSKESVLTIRCEPKFKDVLKRFALLKGEDMSEITRKALQIYMDTHSEEEEPIERIDRKLTVQEQGRKYETQTNGSK